MKKTPLLKTPSGKDKISQKAIKNILVEIAEPKYQKFSSSLIPNIPPERILGVRLPKLRRLSEEILRDDWKRYLANAGNGSFEEVMLQGMVIGKLQGNLEEILEYIRQFLPKIDNWSTCDSFCSGLKITKIYPGRIWEFLQPCFHGEEEYTVRFAVVMLLNYYVEEAYLEQALGLLEEVDHESYYVKMAVAWAISIFYIHFPDRVLEFLQKAKLDDFTYNKSLQKIIESRQVPEESKAVMRGMKQKS